MVAKYCPDLLEEVKGIAAGSGLDFDTIFAYQLLPEEWVFETTVNQPVVRAEHCSIVGVRSNPPLLAQNMDINRFYDGGQVHTVSVHC